MLPAKSCASSAANASRSSVRTSRPSRAANRSRKCRASFGNVLAPLAQRRQHDLDDAQPVVEVLPELAARDPLRRAARSSRRGPARRSGCACGRRRARSRAPGARGGASPGAPAACRRPRPGRACPRWPPRSGPRGPRRPSRRRARCRRARTREGSPGSAAQLIAEKSFSARSLRAWIIRATSSLPVPLSPVIRTEVREGATRPTRSSTRRAAGESPTKSRPAADRPVSSSRRRFSSSSRSRSRVSRSRWRRFSIAIPQRPASETRKRASSSSKPAFPPRRSSLSARTRTPTVRPPARIGTPIAAETRLRRSRNVSRRTAVSERRSSRDELVLGDDGFRGPAREADPRLGAAGAALAERREVPARRVEDPDRPAEDVLDEGFLVGKRAEREPGVVEGLEKEELVLSLELRRPIHHREAACTLSRCIWPPPAPPCGSEPSWDSICGSPRGACPPGRGRPCGREARRGRPGPHRPSAVDSKSRPRVGGIDHLFVERDRLVGLALGDARSSPACSCQKAQYGLYDRALVVLGEQGVPLRLRGEEALSPRRRVRPSQESEHGLRGTSLPISQLGVVRLVVRELPAPARRSASSAAGRPPWRRRGAPAAR